MKKFKRVITSIGLFAVMLVFFCVTCLADDIAVPTPNIVPITDMYQMKQMVISGYDPEQGEGYELTSTIGSPFTIFINTNSSGSFDSRDRISLYVGNETENRYRDIDIQHWGSGEDGEYYIISDFYLPNNEQSKNIVQALTNNYIQIEYDEFVYSLSNIDITDFDPIDADLIPYSKIEMRNFQDELKAEYINVNYEFEVYTEVEAEGGTKISTEKIQYTETIPTGVVTTISSFPMTYFKQMKQDGETIVYIANLKTTYSPSDIVERYSIGFINDFVTEERLIDYHQTIADWIEANVPKIDRWVEIDVSSFLITAVSGFFAFELYPGLSIMGIVAFLIAIPLLMLILKVFKD